MERVPMTLEGLKNLEDELQRLKAVERPRIIAAISEARAHGDLSENAEYHAAKEQQGMNEARVAEIEDKINRAEVIDISKTVRRHDQVRRDGDAFGRGFGRQGHLHHRRRYGSKSARSQDLDIVADRPGADRQIKGRERRRHDAEGHTDVRSA